jgi:hypothetical protein
MSIDSYRLLDFATRQVMKAWAARQHAGVIAFTTLKAAQRMYGGLCLDGRHRAQRRPPVRSGANGATRGGAT